MCVLTATGLVFDVDAFVHDTSLTPYSIFRKGERRFPNSERNQERNEFSGLKIDVSEKEWDDLPGQLSDALTFLTSHSGELRRLVRFPGVEDVRLDFPYNLRIDAKNVLGQCDYLPPALLREAGNLGVGIELSLYPAEASI